MALEFKKVYPEDYSTILPLLEKFQSAFSDEQKRQLFKIHWKVSIDFCGVKIEDNGAVIAYLGLIFSERNFNGNTVVFCNLTSLVIDEKYRGQKLTHRIVQYLQSLGNFMLTAITPIPSLYKMYESNGFKCVSDYRTVFWKLPFYTAAPAVVTSNWQAMAHRLTTAELAIAQTHTAYNCKVLLFSVGEKSVLLVVKNRSGQRRKFITAKVIGYIDLLCRKIARFSLLDTIMVCPEIHYCSDYKFLMQHIAAFAAAFFKAYKAYSCFCMRKEFTDKYQPKYFLTSSFLHSRQMFYSAELGSEDYDTLYSEIFVLDM
ncbi:MAG: hypothetical protein KF872_02985 [Chitinophagales bacterium]|nr:hypothetical protein [Chitinophagales bacterium]